MERHPDEEELTALALGTLPGEPAELLRHLTTCPACRSAYDDLSAAVDAVLPAAPRVAAPPGFDARVLERLERLQPLELRRQGMARESRTVARWSPSGLRRLPLAAHRVPSASRRTPSPGHRSRRLPLLVAAAAVAGLSLGGVVGAEVLSHRSTPAQVTASDHGAVLTTRSGARVGTVEPSRLGTDRVIVMQITAGRPRAHYTCRLLLKDGSSRDAGQWWTPASGRATWIAYGSAGAVDRVELVTDDGHVWSSAELGG
ncbi:anti-sigma factor family protein [Streptomyces sp. CA-249302]|uniref:anti-sigma factor family protein n=1 Tax=Streptomyces sp. CA-249302 TaxID=3240058 RepID=UPI003D8C628E